MIHFAKLAVFGLGVSGLSVLRAFRALETEIIAWDDRDGARREAEGLGADMMPLSADALRTCDALIMAPGISPDHEIVRIAGEAGIEVMCDIELWHRIHPNARVIGITGTNGKSTVTALVHHILIECGMQAQMGGNIGTPLFDLRSPMKHEWMVLELSSYQIEYCPTFNPEIAVLLNITPDHLDRHGTMDNYATIKGSLFEDAGRGVIAVDDEWTRGIAETIEPIGERSIMRVSGHGDHREQNRATARAVSELLDLNPQRVEEAIACFKALPHRQNLVRVMGDVSYINDSKATNPVSTCHALESFEDVVWIVGGQIKEGGLQGLESSLSHVRHACVIGEHIDEVTGWLTDHGIEHSVCLTMSCAVENSFRRSLHGDIKTVLLSPAAASFDQYRNFEARGREFEILVGELKDVIEVDLE